MKRKLLLAALFVVSALGFNAKAYTVDDLTSSGWTKVESITNVENQYYVFVGAGTSKMMMTATDDNGRAYYYYLTNPLTSKAGIWTLEETGTENTYALKSENRNMYFNSGSAGWNNGFGSTNDSGNYVFTLSDGKYSLKRTAANEFLGPWNNHSIEEPVEEINLAANKTAGQAPGFYIYSMSRSDYAAKQVALGTQASKESPIEMTDAIVNPDFGYVNSNHQPTGWMRTGSAGNQQWGNGTFESWNNSNVYVYQDLRGLPNGLYKATVDIISGPGASKSAYLYAKGASEIKSETVSAEASADNYTTMGNEVAGNTVVADNVVVNDGTLTIGIKSPDGWIVFDNFKLYYYGTQIDLSIYIDAYNAALNAAKAYQSAEMSDFALSALNTAITNNTIADPENSTQEALEAATTNLNIAVESAKVAVSNWTLVKSGVIPTDNAAGWAISTKNGGLACNTWSTEGNSDGSGMTTPFIQDHIGAGIPLAGGEAGGKLYYTLEGLVPGTKYSVSALVRAFNESATGVEGASFFVGSDKKSIDEYGSSCIGDYAAKGKFGNFTCTGEVDSEGKLVFGIELESTSAINWVAIKNVTIEESSGIVPTSIALDNTNISLITGNTATITATITPDDAEDKTIVWSSSDPTIATVSGGVVTGLKPGNVTITAAALAGNNVTATATITVANAPAVNYSSALSEGDFYIRNVANGRFFGQGNNWNTQASTTVHGKPVKLTLSNGKYKMTNIVASSNGLGSDCYTDNGTPVELEFTEVAPNSNVYTIGYNGNLTAANPGNTIVSYQSTDASNYLAQWQLLTVEDMEKNLWTGSDATFYIKGALAQRDATTNSAWTASNVTTRPNDGFGSGNAEACSESWHKDAFSQKQEITVPNGTYRLSVQGFITDGAVVELFANDVRVSLVNINSESITQPNSRGTAALAFKAGHYYNSLEVTVTDNKLTLGVEGSTTNSWSAWNNYELTLLDYTKVNTITAVADNNEVEIGETATITTTLDPETASFPKVYYTSSNEAIAMVSAEGVVTAVAEGNAEITAMANGKTATVNISVVKPAVIPTTVTMSAETVELTSVANTATLTATVGPDGAPQAITWTSSDATVATVDANGVVTGISTGKATIKATAYGYDEAYGETAVTVTFPETAMPTSTYVNDGPKRSITTVTGENLIKNGTFEYPNGFYGWTNGAGGNIDATNFAIVDGALNAKNSNGAGYAASIDSEWSIEAGKTYVFAYKVKGNPTNSKYMVVSLANDPASTDENNKISDDNTPVTNEWSEVKYVFTNTGGYAYLQFRARWLGNSVHFDDFYLAEVTTTEEGNIDYAKAAIPTANIGEGVFQYSQTAVDNANALVQGTATVVEVQNAYDALQVLNAPDADTRYAAVLKWDGWTYDNKAMTYIAGGRTDAGGYNIQYLKEQNSNYAQAFIFTPVEGELNTYLMSQIDNDGVERYISTGKPHGGNANQIRTVTESDKALKVKVIATTKEGICNLYNTEENKYIGSQDAGVFTVNSHIDFAIVEAQPAEVTLNSDGGYYTLMLPFAAELPTGMKAYTCAEVEGNVLTLTEATSFAPNTPYIVVEGAGNHTFSGYGLATADTYTEGLLKGAYAQTDVPAGSYVLAVKPGETDAKFYVVGDAGAKLPAYRAYLKVANSEVKAFTIGRSDATGISAIEALQNGDAEIYTINGTRVNTLQKGINIVKMSNGKTQKVLVK